jgi:uncharacterized alpha-E superfamily protein
MLLGRTANGLFWMHRYIERAENMARLVDAGVRISLTRSTEAEENWRSVLESAGTANGFFEKFDTPSEAAVIDYLLRDRDNPSSVITAIELARQNARMVRTALTRESWEATNDAWMRIRSILSEPVRNEDLPAVLDAIKQQGAYISGAFHGTKLRNEIFNFANLGTYVERADNTARILDVKYYVLLPSVALVGSALDTFQWESILRSVSAHRSYRWEYGGEYSAVNIADFLIHNPRMPRSLRFCYKSICENLSHIDADYGSSQPCHDRAKDMLEQLKSMEIQSIMDNGLHEFLSDFILANGEVAAGISTAYRFYE